MTEMILDGMWLRAPYLHRESVPTLRYLSKTGGNPDGRRERQAHRQIELPSLSLKKAISSTAIETEGGSELENAREDMISSRDAPSCPGLAQNLWVPPVFGSRRSATR